MLCTGCADSHVSITEINSYCLLLMTHRLLLSFCVRLHWGTRDYDDDGDDEIKVLRSDMCSTFVLFCFHVNTCYQVTNVPYWGCMMKASLSPWQPSKLRPLRKTIRRGWKRQKKPVRGLWGKMWHVTSSPSYALLTCMAAKVGEVPWDVSFVGVRCESPPWPFSNHQLAAGRWTQIADVSVRFSLSSRVLAVSPM